MPLLDGGKFDVPAVELPEGVYDRDEVMSGPM
jgi:hypothetical protein